MSMKLWENLVRRGNSRDATSIEATVTADRVEAATATSEALFPDKDE